MQQFRELILKPVLQTLDKRGLTGQIDCIAYSADLPYSVHVQGDLGEHKLHGVSTPDASINGLTYLYPLVLTKDAPGYLSLTANRYFRHVAGAPEHRARATDSRQRADQAKKSEAATLETQPPRAFHGETGWSSAGEPASPSEGRRYLLSTMLAMTSGRGNSVHEAIDGLRRSVAADGAWPKGTIYYLENGDIRSTTRQWGFLSAARRLKQLGVAAEVLQGVLPQKKADVAGAMIGAADFNWKSSGSTILPGAICEHLTSFGGSMQESGGQTPISELLRYGAAGSSGTVTEPYAIQNKFPTPFLHVYYASGCTLAEAFYQSVRGPYQLLIIGDPLCRPWAAIPQVQIEGPLGAAITGPTILRAVTGQGVKAGRSELYLDGRRVSRLPCGGEIRIDGGSLSDGYHEIRASIAVADPIETQGNAIVPIVVDNHGRSIQVDLPPKSVRLDQWVRLRARMPQARRILLAAQLAKSWPRPMVRKRRRMCRPPSWASARSACNRWRCWVLPSRCLFPACRCRKRTAPRAGRRPAHRFLPPNSAWAGPSSWRLCPRRRCRRSSNRRPGLRRAEAFDARAVDGRCRADPPERLARQGDQAQPGIRAGRLLRDAGQGHVPVPDADEHRRGACGQRTGPWSGTARSVLFPRFAGGRAPPADREGPHGGPLRPGTLFRWPRRRQRRARPLSV